MIKGDNRYSGMHLRIWWKWTNMLNPFLSLFQWKIVVRINGSYTCHAYTHILIQVNNRIALTNLCEFCMYFTSHWIKSFNLNCSNNFFDRIKYLARQTNFVIWSLRKNVIYLIIKLIKIINNNCNTYNNKAMNISEMYEKIFDFYRIGERKKEKERIYIYSKINTNPQFVPRGFHSQSGNEWIRITRLRFIDVENSSRVKTNDNNYPKSCQHIKNRRHIEIIIAMRAAHAGYLMNVNRNVESI